MSEAMIYLEAASWLATACGIAAFLAAVLPPATDASPGWWQHVRRVLDVLAMNVANSRNRVQ